jgi:AAA+ ATPase superfamily predicted ATPase
VEILQRPVTGEDLFDREILIDSLTKKQKNFALIGPRKSGKTSLMWEIRPKLEQKGILCPYIYVLFEDTDTSFLVRYVNLCLYHFIRKQRGGDIPGIFEDSFETLAEQITQTIEIKPQLTKHLLKLREALLKPPDFGTLEMALKLPAALAADEDTKFMIMIDEFQNVTTLSLPVADVLRRQIMAEARVNYLAAGSEVGMMKDILESGEAPLFGHFSIHRVGAFDIDQARLYILQMLKKHGLVIGETGLSFLVTLTGGFPFFINGILEKAVTACKERSYQRVPNDVIIQAIEKVSFYTDGILYIHFKDTLEKAFKKRNMGKYLTILKAIALGNHTVSKIASAAVIRTTSLPVYLDFLKMAELIRKTREGYQLTDPFLEFWLKACLRVQESSTFPVQEKLSTFQRDVQVLLNSVRSRLGKAREAQVREMFYLSDQYINTRGGMLQDKEFDLITYKGNQLVLGEVKTGSVTLAEVLTFANKLEQVSEEAVGILFVLDTIYPDALSAASERNIQVWDIARINDFRKELRLEKLVI